MAIAWSILQQLAFPVLETRQIDRLRPHGTIENTRPGQILYECGQSTSHLVVVLEGQTNVIDRSNMDRILRQTGLGEFNGELGLLTGQKAITACVVDKAGRVLLVPARNVHEIISTIPDLSDILVTAFAARRQVLMQSTVASLTIIGRGGDPSVLHLLMFADRNRIPYRWLDPDNPADAPAISSCGFPEGNGFRAILGGQVNLLHPTPLELARAIGLDLDVRQDGPSDLIVVGGGPAGLAAAVFGASEGLATVVVEDTAIGGQAGTSSRIENYVGFPAGISGNDLAFRAEVQALKFGAQVAVPRRAVALEQRAGVFAVHLHEGGPLLGRSVVIATGARYRRLTLPGQEALEGAGIYYAATDLEARRCFEKEVIVVGGGNSAGQAAMFLSEHAKCVHVICRGDNLEHSMSAYLITRLRSTPNVRIQLRTEITQVFGTEVLESATITNRMTGESQRLQVEAIFVMIGAVPCSGWLKEAVELDTKGFVRTGLTPVLITNDHSQVTMNAILSPYSTSLTGVFAVGDIRSRSVKRVASAVGEGSVVIQSVHQYLANSKANETRSNDTKS